MITDGGDSVQPNRMRTAICYHFSLVTILFDVSWLFQFMIEIESSDGNPFPLCKNSSSARTTIKCVEFAKYSISSSSIRTTWTISHVECDLVPTYLLHTYDRWKALSWSPAHDIFTVVHTSNSLDQFSFSMHKVLKVHQLLYTMQTVYENNYSVHGYQSIMFYMTS